MIGNKTIENGLTLVKVKQKGFQPISQDSTTKCIRKDVPAFTDYAGSIF